MSSILFGRDCKSTSQSILIQAEQPAPVPKQQYFIDPYQQPMAQLQQHGETFAWEIM